MCTSVHLEDYCSKTLVNRYLDFKKPATISFHFKSFKFMISDVIFSFWFLNFSHFFANATATFELPTEKLKHFTRRRVLLRDGKKTYIRCNKLEEDFFAAGWLNLNCNLGEFGMSQPLGVSVETLPVFLINHLEGIPVRAKVFVPVACYWKVVG